jgi:hypothetical protein
MASNHDLLTTCLESAQKSMLSVGSGDGSQQQAIVKEGVVKLLATFYDSRPHLLRKYPHAKTTLAYLESHCREPPRFQVDATKLDQYNLGTFDLIFFTFPHSGIPNSDPRNMESNQRLLRGFLKSAAKLLKAEGEIQITLKKGEHYDQWKLPSLLDTDGGLQLYSTHALDKSKFPGYKHRLTTGMQGPLTEVPDKKGAMVHVFRPKFSLGAGAKGSTPMFAGKLLTIVQPPPPSVLGWSDEDLWTQIVVILESFSAPATVLEIRRQMTPIPDTRQLNRIVYAMEKEGLVERHAPHARNCNKSQKPRWTLG